jgi:hypothetical protein
MKVGQTQGVANAVSHKSEVSPKLQLGPTGQFQQLWGGTLGRKAKYFLPYFPVNA